MALALSILAAADPPTASMQGGSRVAPSLAKAKLKEATTAAKAWRADARLIQVAGRGVGDDGLIVIWAYGFFSPTARTCLVVRVGVQTTSTESGGAICEAPELTDFLDSDQAIKIARANGITNPKSNMYVSVGARTKQPLWVVMDGNGMRTGDATVEIDGSTGKVVGKSKMP